VVFLFVFSSSINSFTLPDTRMLFMKRGSSMKVEDGIHRAVAKKAEVRGRTKRKMGMVRGVMREMKGMRK
jgi:hypothetical protein